MRRLPDSILALNAALVEQAAAASQSLQDRAAGLSQAMSVFTVGARSMPQP